MSERWLLILFAVGVSYLALFYKIGNMAFIGADEPRYARISQEMNERHDYVTPTLEGRPWLEKPPLLFWMQAGSFALLGVSEWSARLPVALSAVVAALAIAFMIRNTAGAAAGFHAFLILATAPLFFVYGRAGSTDMPLLAALTLALVTGFEAARRSSIGWAVGAGAALGLAVLAKGPVALFLFAGIFLVYGFLTQSFPWTWKQTVSGIAVFLVVAVPWYWLVWLENGANFVATFWINHHLARFLTPIHHHSQPFWYFVPVLLVGFFPWVPFLFSAAGRLLRHRRAVCNDQSTEIFLWIWFLVPFVFFSLSNSKLAGYILPVLPALAALTALEWDRLLQGEVIARRWIRGEIIGLFSLGLLFCFALVLGFFQTYGAPWIGLALGGSLLLGLVGALYYYRARRLRALFLALVAALTLFAALAYWLAAPVLDDFHSARNLSQLARTMISTDRPLILYRYFHHTALYYTDYRSTSEALPDRESLRSYFQTYPQEKYLILTQKPGWQDLQEAFQVRLIRHQGNLYLLEVTP
ncbi:MAG TPA: glycosyltransferase family 39 protein [Acidobacteriota bacterium]|nr:glycosyltransferase family 39 protein [Acidobacteriota bacterium]